MLHGKILPLSWSPLVPLPSLHSPAIPHLSVTLPPSLLPACPLLFISLFWFLHHPGQGRIPKLAGSACGNNFFLVEYQRKTACFVRVSESTLLAEQTVSMPEPHVLCLPLSDSLPVCLCICHCLLSYVHLPQLCGSPQLWGGSSLGPLKNCWWGSREKKILCLLLHWDVIERTAFSNEN